MSKTHSIALSKLYLIELILLSLGALAIGVVVTINLIKLTKPVAPPPLLDIQQLELQKAINIIQTSE